VSLLITQLAFIPGSEVNPLARLSVLIASLIAAAFAIAFLQIRKQVHKNKQSI
jgi:Na+/H+ antiporter NhaA